MKIVDLFTNAGKEAETDVKAPAFSLTKVQAGIGTLITVIAGAAAKAEGTTAVKVAAIGAGALVMLGVFGLAAVDLLTRQRAAEAKLRWGAGAGRGGGGSGGGGKTNLFADADGLVLQAKRGGDEYDLALAELDGDKVTLVARRKGKSLEPTFRPRS